MQFEQEDLNTETELVRTLEDGRREFRLVSATYKGKRVAGIPFFGLTAVDAVHKRAAAPDAMEEAREAGEDIETAFRDIRVQGVTSSTSVDWYGTEMSKRALDNMADQFRNGVAITPAHNGFFSVQEWRDQLGTSTDAVVERAEVLDPADTAEPGYLLRITFKLYESSEDARDLVSRLDEGQTIGLSIGGWFTEVRFIVNEDDETERVIIDRVMLDHSAITRAPANPDSMGLQVMRSVTFSTPSEERTMPDNKTSEEPTVPDLLSALKGLDEEGLAAVRNLLLPAPEGEPEERAKTPEVPEEPEERATPAPEKPVEDPAETAPASDDNSVTRTGGEENEMNEQMQALMAQLAESQRALAEATTQLSERLDGEEKRSAPEPAPTPEPKSDPEVEALRAKLAEVESALEQTRARFASQPVVKGFAQRGFFPSSGAPKSQLDAMIERSRSKDVGAHSVAAATEQFRDVFEADRFESESNISRAKLEESLKSICRAAVLDGIIRDPADAQVAWS